MKYNYSHIYKWFEFKIDLIDDTNIIIDRVLVKSSTYSIVFNLGHGLVKLNIRCMFVLINLARYQNYLIPGSWENTRPTASYLPTTLEA